MKKKYSSSKGSTKKVKAGKDKERPRLPFLRNWPVCSAQKVGSTPTSYML
jgi:hypothetical protein